MSSVIEFKNKGCINALLLRFVKISKVITDRELLTLLIDLQINKILPCRLFNKSSKYKNKIKKYTQLLTQKYYT